MSRFADMTPEEVHQDPAVSVTRPNCDHPPECRTDEDSGGVICSPSCYCTRCERLVINPPQAAGATDEEVRTAVLAEYTD